MLESTDGSAAERVAADEGEARRQCPGSVDDRPLGAAGIRDDRRLPDVLVELGQQRDVLTHGRGENDQVGLGEHHHVVGRDVDGMETHRRLEDILVIDSDDQRRRPELTRREGNRPADETEPDNADLLEHRGLGGYRAAGLDDWKLHESFRERRSCRSGFYVLRSAVLGSMFYVRPFDVRACEARSTPNSEGER
jgi:hypothetical protein